MIYHYFTNLNNNITLSKNLKNDRPTSSIIVLLNVQSSSLVFLYFVFKNCSCIFVALVCDVCSILIT